MVDERRAKVVLEYNVDKSALAAVDASAKQVEARLAAITKQTNDITSASQKMNSALRDALKDPGDKSFKRLVDLRVAANDAKKGYDELRDSLLNSEKAAAKSGKFGVEGLRRTGGALSQLGFGELGGAASRAGDIGQVAKEAGELTQALGPLAPLAAAGAGALIGFQLGVKVLELELADGKKALEGAVTGLDAYYKALDAGTTASIQNQLKALQNKNRLELTELNQLQAARAAAFKSEQNGFGGDLAARIKFGLGEAAGAFKPVDERIKALTESTTGASSQLSALEQALKSTDVATNDAAEAEKKLTQARLAGLDEELQRELKIEQLKRNSSTSKQVQELLDSATQEAASIRDRIPALEAEAKKSEEGAAKLKAYQDRLKSLNKDIDAYKQLLDQLKGKDAVVNFVKGLLNLPKDIAKTTEPLKKELDKQVQEVVDRDKRVADVQKKYNDDVANIEQRSLQARADIQKKYNDKLVDLARQAADDAAASLRKLHESRADLARNLGRDEQKAERDAVDKRLDIQIAAQREEAKAYRDHQRDLEQIRKQASDREFDLILNRDFLGLFNSRRQTTTDINNSNAQFNAGRQDATTAQRQQGEDLQRSLESERRERQIAYQNNLEDARIAYNREIADQQRKHAEELILARQARDQDLRELNSKTVQELNAKRRAYIQELQLASTMGATRVKLEAQIQQALLNQARATLSQLSGPTSAKRGGSAPTAHRAGGGYLERGQAAWVNESFNGVPFPPSMGMFIPAQGGNVTRSISANQTNNIYGSNPQQMLGLIDNRFEQLMEAYLG